MVVQVSPGACWACCCIGQQQRVRQWWWAAESVGASGAAGPSQSRSTPRALQATPISRTVVLRRAASPSHVATPTQQQEEHRLLVGMVLELAQRVRELEGELEATRARVRVLEQRAPPSLE